MTDADRGHCTPESGTYSDADCRTTLDVPDRVLFNQVTALVPSVTAIAQEAERRYRAWVAAHPDHGPQERFPWPEALDCMLLMASSTTAAAFHIQQWMLASTRAAVART